MYVHTRHTQNHRFYKLLYIADFTLKSTFNNNFFSFLNMWRNLKNLNIYILYNNLYIRFFKSTMWYVFHFVFYLTIWNLVIVSKNNFQWSRLTTFSSPPPLILKSWKNHWCKSQNLNSSTEHLKCFYSLEFEFAMSEQFFFRFIF